MMTAKIRAPSSVGDEPPAVFDLIQVVIRDNKEDWQTRTGYRIYPLGNGHGPDGDPTASALTKVYDTLMASNNNMNQMMQTISTGNDPKKP